MVNGHLAQTLLAIPPFKMMFPFTFPSFLHLSTQIEFTEPMFCSPLQLVKTKDIIGGPSSTGDRRQNQYSTGDEWLHLRLILGRPTINLGLDPQFMILKPNMGFDTSAEMSSQSTS
ncbi:PREDICTED: uncharacterized protein LOC104598317 [Nelumbo nucifera]|uniref:Uncharacterized protein LOC104598317 n=1 Tax=Nelumbo nucifera TaxID=4432 RepID=A0A1U7ZXU5_NELNU|nr:PREDICTED: uncharacterized protein LOC104598317 [Nelumbo nucifera]